jgi:hypothetical protein
MVRLTDALRAKLEQTRKELLAHADDRSSKLAKELLKIERQMIRIVERPGATAIDMESLNRVTAQLNRVILEGNPEVAAWLREELPYGAMNGLKTQAAFLAQEGGAIANADRVKQTYDTFQAGIESKKLLRLTPEAMGKRWAVDWTDRFDKTMSGLQSRFLRAQSLGQSWTDVANAIQDQFGGLDVAVGDPEVWARAFARTKLTEIATDTSIKFAREIGIDKFVNIGVPDDRQADECTAASNQPPMTLAEWEASPWGIPPRHYNCRCDLAGVPDDVKIGQGVKALEEAVA